MNRPWDILFICWSKSVTATAAAEDTRIVTATPAPNQTAAESTSEQVERVPLDKESTTLLKRLDTRKVKKLKSNKNGLMIKIISIRIGMKKRRKSKKIRMMIKESVNGRVLFLSYKKVCGKRTSGHAHEFFLLCLFSRFGNMFV